MFLKRELIYIDGNNETDRIVSYSRRGGKCDIVFRNSNKLYSYNINRVRIIKTAISDDKAYSIFRYLQEVVESIGLRTEDGENILAKSYQRISVISKDCVLASYLSGIIPSRSSNPRPIEVFPFGFNISQRGAVDAAFSCPISVIEGPPRNWKNTNYTQYYCQRSDEGKECRCCVE